MRYEVFTAEAKYCATVWAKSAESALNTAIASGHVDAAYSSPQPYGNRMPVRPMKPLPKPAPAWGGQGRHRTW